MGYWHESCPSHIRYPSASLECQWFARLPSTMKHRWWLYVMGAVVLGFVALQYLRRDFLAFEERRELWHVRCDAHLQTPQDPLYADCTREERELVAYAQAKGWLE